MKEMKCCEINVSVKYFILIGKFLMLYCSYIPTRYLSLLKTIEISRNILINMLNVRVKGMFQMNK